MKVVAPSHRSIFDRFASEFNIERQEDWYKVTVRGIYKKKGAFQLLRKHYGFSLFAGLTDVYKEFRWNAWSFPTVPRRFWKNVKHRRQFFEWFAEETGMDKMEDWYEVKVEEVKEKGGSGMLQLHRLSLYGALKSLFPSFPWIPWRFIHLPSRFWSDLKNRRRFLDWFADQEDIQSQHDWYEAKLSEVDKKGGKSLLHYYNYSLIKASSEVYPECTWHFWLFHKVPSGFWKEEDNVKKFVQWMEDKLEIKETVEWYNVPYRLIHSSGGTTLLRNIPLPLLLSKCYPSYSWISSDFDHRTKSQETLVKTLQDLLPNHTIRLKVNLSSLCFGP